MVYRLRELLTVQIENWCHVLYITLFYVFLMSVHEVVSKGMASNFSKESVLLETYE